MADRIGKYEIVERIGRGGMGTVYKARDTRLNRMVALKVVSPEVELTDELRSRFFDEAQSCAGLSHPNIVTIYDVGEEDDRLYIVMELLDGQELKRMIADHVVISLEEKVSVMIQLCDALSYAHDKGIIHRDIKPGNILFQRTGPAKIIDFGIAKMATSSSLTRTGLIMGTLRYMSPEQVRGRADTRSDQFSLAAVFYEMLSYRPPYIGEDPIQLLEQLRTESPPSLLDLDPSIPPELARVVERGMNKDPGDRYPDLRSMRDDLEVVQRRIHEESQRLRKHFAALVAEVQEADAAASARIGGPVFEDPFTPTDTQPLIVSLKDKIAAAEQRLEALRDFTNKVDSLESALQRGRELLHGDQFTEARTVLEAVVREIPQHIVARSILEQARLGEDLKLRRVKTRELLDEAARALQADDLVRCLTLIQSAADLPAIPEAEDEIAALRRAAKTAQSEQDASRRARQQAERAREQVNEARKHAEKQDAPALAAAAWANACARNDQGEEHFREERYSEALLSFDTAAEAFAAAEEEARESKLEQQRAADQAKVAEREQLASRLLDEVRSEFAGRAFVRCQEILRQVEEIPPPDSVRDEYRRLAQETEAALHNERRSRKPAQQARMLMTAMRVDAQAEGAANLASSTWQEGEAKATTGSAAFVREMFAEAREVFDSATETFQRALEEARAAKSAAPSPSSSPEAPAPAASGAEGLLAEARSALDKGRPDVCMDLLARAAMASPPPEVQGQINALLRTAADAAREKQAPSRSESERKRARATRAAEQLEEALQLAKRLGEPVVAPRIWAELEKKIASARVSFGRDDFDAAFEDYEAAIQLCQRFSDAARAAEKARTADGAPTVVRMPEPPQRTTALDDATVFRAPAASRTTSRSRQERPERSKMLMVALGGGAVLAVLVAVFFPRGEPQQTRVVAQEFDPNAAAEAPAAQAPVAEGSAPAGGAAAVVAATGNVDDKAIADAQTAAEAKAAAEERAKTEAGARAVAGAAAAAQANAEQETRGEAAKAQADADAKAAAQARAAAEEKAAAEARAVMEARIAAEEKAAALARAEAAVRAQSDTLAKEKAAAQARAETEARLTARDRAEAEARESVKARMAEQARLADEEIAAAKAKAEVEAKARAEARAAAEAKADAEATRKLAAEAKAAAAARAAEQDKIEADARAKAKREADALAQARREADALAKARRELEAEEKAEAARQARELQLARAPLAEELSPPVPVAPSAPITPKGTGLLKGAHASVFVEATDGMKGGGAWGACWRTDPSAARSCAKSGCEQTRSTGRACQEIAATQPGGYCAVARASGFGVSSGVCADSASAAEGGAVSACLSQVRRTYGAVQASCRVVWSTDR